MSCPYAGWGLFLILASLFPLTFGGLHEGGSSAHVNAPPPGAVVRFVALLVAAGAATLANLLLPRRPSRTTFPELAVLVVLVILGGYLFFSEGGAGTTAAVFFNFLLLALVLGAIGVGCWNREPAWVNLGIFFFALLVMVRYFDWFWALLPRSAFFIGAGLLLLFGGMALERTRRRVVTGWRKVGGEP
jgi:uncharacterized membrane protein